MQLDFFYEKKGIFNQSDDCIQGVFRMTAFCLDAFGATCFLMLSSLASWHQDQGAHTRSLLDVVYLVWCVLVPLKRCPPLAYINPITFSLDSFALLYDTLHE
jgi:hypothetical protein